MKVLKGLKGLMISALSAYHFPVLRHEINPLIIFILIEKILEGLILNYFLNKHDYIYGDDDNDYDIFI